MSYQFRLPVNVDHQGSVINWTDEDIARLRRGVLKKTLSIFSDGRSCLRARTEALEWLMDDSIHPFSFRICCESIEVDAVSLRDKVLEMLKRRKK